MARAVLPCASAHAMWMLTGCTDAPSSAAERQPPLELEDLDEQEEVQAAAP